ncbi:hypothetical protein KY362_01640 [Candidatus Woesearchaeota archaeon]|nr:hypothetical protein [Candidatus Woesearchaeota archaeon]
MSASALADELGFDRIEVTRDGTTVLSTGSTSGSLDVEPGDELRIRVKLENTFDDSTDNDIEDVRVTAVIEDIDDGDDIDDSETADVRADSYKVVYLRLDIPEDASSYESYELEITARGYDQDDTLHEASASFDLDVEREEHELVIEELRMDDVMCDREAYVRLEIQNTGEEDEWDVELELTSPSLGAVFRDTFDIDSVHSGGDSIYQLDKRLDLDGLSPGRHTLSLNVEYDGGRRHLQETIDFNVESCGRYDSASETLEKDRQELRDIRTERTEERRDRDLSFLYGSENLPVELFLPDAQEPAPRIPQPDPRDSPFSIAVLVIANAAILVFIILLIWALWDRYA